MAESIASRAPGTFEQARRRTRLRGLMRVRGIPKRDRAGPVSPRIHARKPLPRVGAPAFTLGSLCRGRQLPHSCGGGALQRSEKSVFLAMRFSAGHFGASQSSRSILELGLSNPISNLGHYQAATQSVTNSPKLSHSGNNTLLLTYTLTNASLYPALPLSLDKIWRRKSAPEKDHQQAAPQTCASPLQRSHSPARPPTSRTIQCPPPKTQRPQRLCGIFSLFQPLTSSLQPPERRRKI